MVTAPRVALGQLPTPLVRAERLERRTRAEWPILLKRDDLIGFGAAGNKARTLEFLVGAALRDGCDTLVTGGGPSSNFCQAAALAARRYGLDCELIVYGEPAARNSPNLLIAQRAGARLRPIGDGARARVDAEIDRVAAELAAAGRRPYPMPRGGSTPVGALGFATAVEELSAQLGDFTGEPVLVVLPVGSGGSCAGLLAGLAGTDWRVLGASVSRSLPEIRAKVEAVAGGCADLLGAPPPDPARLDLVDARGPGFGKAAEADRRAARIALETEGLLLDSTYTAKSFAVLLARLRAGVAGPVVWWHTGGLVPAVAGYTAKQEEPDEPALA